MRCSGWLLAWVGLPLLRQLLPADFPRAHEIALTMQGALFAAAIALATVLVAGLLASGGIDAPQAHQRVTAGRDRETPAHRPGRRRDCPRRRCSAPATLFLLRSYERDWRPRSRLRRRQAR